MRSTPQLRFTTRADGDLRVGGEPAALAARRRAVVDLPWTWLHQVHGSRVVRVDAPGAQAGEEADAAVTAVRGAALAVHTADCAPIALLADGAVGVVHAGWRGLAAGVVEAAAAEVHALAAGRVTARVGPCIGVECYEFGARELDRVADALGDGVRGTAASGAPALDLRAAVRAALDRAGVPAVDVDATCTACGTIDGQPLYSHRARGDTARHALVAWLP